MANTIEGSIFLLLNEKLTEIGEALGKVDDVRPLRGSSSTVGKALTTDEKIRLLRVSEARPEWQTARLAMTLALCTTIRGIEIKSLRWRDVDLLRRSFTIRRSKTAAGLRSIPMNDDAYAAVMELWGRASAIGGTQHIPGLRERPDRPSASSAELANSVA